MRGYWGQPATTSEALVRTSTGEIGWVGLAGEWQDELEPNGDARRDNR
ncbi:MAG: hypothetical protein WAL41_19895 [Mycobacterium sp.]